MFTQEELQSIRDAEQSGDLAGASELYYAALERAASSGGDPGALASSDTAVKFTASMVIDAAKAFTPEQLVLPEVRQKVSKYDTFAEKVLGLGGETVAGIGAEFAAAITAGDDGAKTYSGTVGLLSALSDMDEASLLQVMTSVLEDNPSLETSQAAVRLMRLHQEMTGKTSAANDLAQQSLASAVSDAIKGVTTDMAGPAWGDAVTLTAAAGHTLDFAGKRWGVAGINYLSNLVALGRGDIAAILPTLPTYAKASVVAAKNMSGMALSPQGLAAQIQALSEDMNNPQLVKNASMRARGQAVEARLAGLNDAGAFPDIAVQQKEADVRKEMAANSKAKLDKAALQEKSAYSALVAAQTRFAKNPADASAADAVTAALHKLQEASGARGKAEQAFKSSQQALTDAQQKLETAQGKAKKMAEALIRQDLAELVLKRAEQKAGSPESDAGQAGEQGDVPQSQPMPENVSNEGNKGNPLAQVDGSGIMEPKGAQEEAGDAGGTDGRKEEVFSPINPHPTLPKYVQDSFSGGTFVGKVLIEDTTFYRVYGGKAEKVGRYMSRTPQHGALQSQLDLALAPEWGNSVEYVTKVTVPKGTMIYEGTAVPQIINGGTGVLPGGGNQVFIPEVNSSWFDN